MGDDVAAGSDGRGSRYLLDDIVPWWQQILVALGIGGGAFLGGHKLRRDRDKQDPAQRIVDAIRSEGTETRKAIYADGKDTRETLIAGFREARESAVGASLAIARLEGIIGGREP